MNRPELESAMRHQPRLVLSHDVHAKVHGTGTMGRFNTWLAVHITKTVGSRPGWSTMKAVTLHHIVALDDDIASRWGPRVVDLLRTIVQSATAARQG